MTAAALHVNLFDPDFTANPYPTYAQLRDEAPIHRVSLPDGRGLWLITRYDDVAAVFKDPRFVKNMHTALTPAQRAMLPEIPAPVQILFEHLLAVDPPDHTRLRKLVSKAFTPRLIEQLRPRVQLLADELLDRVAAQGQMNLIDDYAFPLPITVIAELLGVPTADQDDFRRWSQGVVSIEPTADRFARLVPDMQAFVAYLTKLFALRRAAPQDDLISALVQVEEAGDSLNERELASLIFLLLIAGHETTVNLIGNGVLALLQHPDQLALLRAKPDLIGPAIEELLRFNGPVETSTLRYVCEDTEFGGVTIPRGEQVLVVIAAADHDPRRFSQPEVLDITRGDNQRHLAFGHGIHYCLGAPLARLEGQIAINTLLGRFPDLRLQGSADDLHWRPSQLIRGLVALPVEW